MMSHQPGRRPGVDDDEEMDGIGGIFRFLRFLGVNPAGRD
jgi:hypothetical protein